MHQAYARLAWLPAAPADFKQRCRALGTSPHGDGRALMHLAKHALDENGLRRLAATIDRLRTAGRPLAPLTPFTLGIVGNASLEPLIPALIATAARYGIALSCTSAAYGQTMQEALNPDAAVNRARPDAVLLAIDRRGLPLEARLGDGASAAKAVADAIAYVDTLVHGFRSNAGAPCIVQTIVPPAETAFGSYDRAVVGAPRALADAFNAKLVAGLTENGSVLFDVAALAEIVGLATWDSPTQWNIAKFPFDAALLPLYADHVCRIIGALRGRSRRCLVLDLDNTVWGGVVGDDGVDGIVVGQGNATGEAFLDVQRLALRLRERGTILAVSSKNEDAVARKPFREHPDMLLREDHIAVFQANWNDKATNIAAIASELALGLDALVFLDDNPAERELVREMLPEVAVPELPEDPAYYARTLAAAGYFEAIAFLREDRERSEYYQNNARRVALKRNVGDLDAYLASLEMRISFAPFDATGRSRISQLVNKSNQFNLTTRRYSELDIAELEADPAAFTLQVRLSDRFGDNGMICVIVCREALSDGSVWEIDTWLMSCRVLGRRVEQMVLRELIYHARLGSVRRLIGSYVPNERNQMVREHYAKLGFERLTEDTAGTTTWVFDTATDVEGAPMVVERQGFAAYAI